LSFPAACRVRLSLGRQTRPQRPVKFIVTLGPGSGVGFGSGLLADRLNKPRGQPVREDKKP